MKPDELEHFAILCKFVYHIKDQIGWFEALLMLMQVKKLKPILRMIQAGKADELLHSIHEMNKKAS